MSAKHPYEIERAVQHLKRKRQDAERKGNRALAALYDGKIRELTGEGAAPDVSGNEGGRT